MRKLLKNKLFMTTLIVDLLSNFGDALYYLALMNYVLLLPDAKFALSLISISEGLPLLFGLIFGYLADRTKNKLRMIISTQLFRMALYLLVGFAMSFTPALWIVLLAIAVNLFSDLAGQYENGLYIPIILRRIVSDEEREASLAFKSALNMSFSMVFNSIGAVLLGIMTYSSLAYLNAGAFAACALIMLGIRPAINRLLQERPLQVAETGEERSHSVRDFWKSLKEALYLVMGIPVVRRCLILLPVLTGLLNGITILVTLIMAEDKDFVLINSQSTLAVLIISVSLGQVFGNILVVSLLKKVSAEILVRISLLPTVSLFLAIYLRSIYLAIGLLFLLGILLGALNTKLVALLSDTLPEDRQAMVINGVTAYVSLGITVFRLILSGLILLMSAQQIVLACLLGSACLAVYILINQRKDSADGSR